MSANQIPAPAYSYSPDRSVHSCATCWRNGGGGHPLPVSAIKPDRAVQALPAWAATTRGPSSNRSKKEN